MRWLAVVLCLAATSPALAEDETGTVVAQVTDAEGQPLADVAIMVWSDEDTWTGRTDEAGSWRQAVAPGDYAAIVRASGWVGREQRDHTVQAGKELELRWELEPGPGFTGRVLGPDGQPIEDARIRVVRGGSFGTWNEMYSDTLPLAREWTDAQGYFRVGGIHPGKIATVIVDADGYREARVGVRATETSVLPSELEITLTRGGDLSGRVVDEEGRAIAGATVFVVPADQDQLRQVPTISIIGGGKMIRALVAHADEAGRFAVGGLAPGSEYVALVEAEGFARYTESKTFVVGDDGACPELVITVPRGGTVVLRLVDDEGAAITSAKVSLGTHMGAAEQEGADEQASYRFRDVRPGRYTLDIEAEGFLPRYEVIEVAAGQEVTPTVHLARGVLLEGLLVDEVGKPAPGIRLSVDVTALDPETGWTRTSSVTATSDAEGRFRLGPVAPGTYELEAFSTRFEIPGGTKVEAPASDLRVVGTWLGTIKVRLVLPDGTPFSGTVWVWQPMGDVPGMWNGSPSEAEDGHLELDEIPSSPLRLELHPDGYVPIERIVSAPAGGTTDLGEIVLDEGHEVRARVVAPDGRPVAEATLTLGRRRVDSDEDGNLVLEHVPAGSCLLELSADGFAKSWPVVDVGPDRDPVVLTLTKGEHVRVALRDAEGQPLPGRRVGIDRYLAGAWKDAGVGRTDADGTFHGNLPAGRVRFVLLPLDVDAAEAEGIVLAEVELVEGAERDMVLTLPAK